MLEVRVSPAAANPLSSAKSTLETMEGCFRQKAQYSLNFCDKWSNVDTFTIETPATFNFPSFSPLDSSLIFGVPFAAFLFVMQESGSAFKILCKRISHPGCFIMKKQVTFTRDEKGTGVFTENF